MKKILLIIFINIFLTFGVNAGTDGENSLSKQGSKEVKDCFEGFNRAVFKFNQGLDTALFEPIAKGYRKLPSPIRKGSGNIVTNLSNLITIPNNILQGELNKAGTNIARLTLNTTVGIFGIFDVASGLGFIEYEKEDYGQTFGTLGAKEGCYLVLPILGPSTARDAIGSAISVLGGDAWYNVTVKNDTQYFKDSDYYISRGTSGVDFRAKNIESFDNLEENSIDFYASVKSLYLQDRQQKILNSKKIIETQNDSDWEEIDTN
jgi:phospholipid-binding lipoprotein MlaA